MTRSVLLLIETSSVYGRDLLSGIVRYMRLHDQWSVFLQQGDLNAKPPRWLADWRGDGIISRLTSEKFESVAKDTGAAIVDLSDRQESSRFDRLTSDDEAIGRMAVEHLAERGFRHFGFCGYEDEAWSRGRYKGFSKAVAELGGRCDANLAKMYDYGGRTWDVEQEQLANWIAAKDRPLGIMACNDQRGRQVLDACQRSKFAVPEQVAVIGVDNDELHCRISMPPLSSIIPNSVQIGFLAAERLAKMMDGEATGDRVVRLPPMDIATRQSTDIVAIDDRLIATSLRLVRENACGGMTVDQVAKLTGISRSKLERDYRRLLHRTPQEEIRRVQIQKARELLSSTKLSVERIAELCGFESSSYLHVVFKRIESMTPGQFRKLKHGG